MSTSNNKKDLRPPGIVPVDSIDDGDMTWLTDGCLSIVVVGASGDLAKKKTYPSLFNLFVDELLPKTTRIFGFARSDLTDDDLRERLRPFLKKSGHSEDKIENFLKQCFYQGGESYGDVDAFGKIKSSMEDFEKENDGVKMQNRLFYFAIPPNVFGDTAVAIKKTCMQEEGTYAKSTHGFLHLVCSSYLTEALLIHQTRAGHDSLSKSRLGETWNHLKN